MPINYRYRSIYMMLIHESRVFEKILLCLTIIYDGYTITRVEIPSWQYYKPEAKDSKSPDEMNKTDQQIRVALLTSSFLGIHPCLWPYGGGSFFATETFNWKNKKLRYRFTFPSIDLWKLEEARITKWAQNGRNKPLCKLSRDYHLRFCRSKSHVMAPEGCWNCEENFFS